MRLKNDVLFNSLRSPISGFDVNLTVIYDETKGTFRRFSERVCVPVKRLCLYKENFRCDKSG